MDNNRLELLLQFYEEDSQDPFNAYALAMEYLNKDTAKAKVYFDTLLDEHPSYLPTYYHAAALYAASENSNGPKHCTKKGWNWLSNNRIPKHTKSYNARIANSWMNKKIGKAWQ